MRIRAELNGKTADVPAAAGKACPRFVFANDQDYGYGRFLLDARSQQNVMDRLGAMPDVFRRALLWGSLWDSVRQADLAPRSYIALAAKLLPAETDESLAQSLLSRTDNRPAPLRERRRAPQFVPRARGGCRRQMTQSSDQGLRIVWFRGLLRLAETPAGLAKLKALAQRRGSPYPASHCARSTAGTW